MAAAKMTGATTAAVPGAPTAARQQCYVRSAQQQRQPHQRAVLSAALSGLLLLLLAAQSPSGVASAQRRHVPRLRGGLLLARGTAGAGTASGGGLGAHAEDVSSALSQHKDSRRRHVLAADAAAAGVAVTSRVSLRSHLLRSLAHEMQDDDDMVVVGAFLDEENPLDGGSDERGGSFIGESADEEDGTVIVQGASSGSS